MPPLGSGLNPLKHGFGLTWLTWVSKPPFCHFFTPTRPKSHLCSHWISDGSFHQTNWPTVGPMVHWSLGWSVCRLVKPFERRRWNSEGSLRWLNPLFSWKRVFNHFDNPSIFGYFCPFEGGKPSLLRMHNYSISKSYNFFGNLTFMNRFYVSVYSWLRFLSDTALVRKIQFYCSFSFWASIAP